MEMSTQYMEELAGSLAERGYELTLQELDMTERVGRVFELRKDAVHMVFTYVTDDAGTTRYYARLVNYHGLETFSHPLDSWKIHSDRVELKFHGGPLGLAFVIRTEIS